MSIPLSNRLQACCGMVHQGERVADIGCDHGYLGIQLLTEGIASFVYAADINEMPLAVAKHNAEKYGCKEKAAFFLSNGLEQVPRDFDCMVCAGMGGDTMTGILEQAPWLRCENYRLILQCQSKRPTLRRYLAKNGFRITKETLVKDGKFLYTVIEAAYAPGDEPQVWEYFASPALLAEHSPLLPAFLKRVTDGLTESLRGLIPEEATQMRTVIEQLRRYGKDEDYD